MRMALMSREAALEEVEEVVRLAGERVGGHQLAKTSTGTQCEACWWEVKVTAPMADCLAHAQNAADAIPAC